MLAEGRVGEAVEYLALSQRLCHEAADATGTLWTLVYLGASLFLGGRFTQCLAYSNDRGRTLTKLATNPVLGNVVGDANILPDVNTPDCNGLLGPVLYRRPVGAGW